MFPAFSLNNRTTVGFCIAIIICGGIWSFFRMGRLEDPEFTIKTALVITLYPGASASDVDVRVTEVVERHIRRVEGVKTTRGISRPGVSIIFVDFRDTIKPARLSNAHQNLRNKMLEVKIELPVEAMSPIVRDDFGDVYGVMFALTGDGISDAELRERAKELQNSFNGLDQVGRVELWGERQEYIDVEVSRARMSELEIHPISVVLALLRHNVQTDAGEMTLGDMVVRLAPAGQFASIDEIANTVISPSHINSIANQFLGVTHDTIFDPLAHSVTNPVSATAVPIRLRDIATVRRVYDDSPDSIMRSNGNTAVVVALAPIAGGDVIKMGKVVREKTDEFMKKLPHGFHLDTVTYQPDNVVEAIGVFERNLLESIVIVTIVVMLTMGWQSGLLITSSLLIVILATLCVLYPMGVILQRTSLGSFIVALGILLDDAIVVGDMILVRMQRGVDRKTACIEGAKKVSMQLLGATLVGAIAFLPVYLTPDYTGEYCRDLFIVILVSLIISWVVSMTQTPVAYYLFVHIPKTDGTNNAPHSGLVYRLYRKLVETALHFKTITLISLLLVLLASLYGFTRIEQIFFPPSPRQQFVIDYWRPAGTSINAVSDDLKQIETVLREYDSITQLSTFVGGGPPRFYLPYDPELPSRNYGTIVVGVQKISDVEPLLAPLEAKLKTMFPDSLVRVRRFTFGPMPPNDVEVRFAGTDHAVLRRLADEAKTIFAKYPDAKGIVDNWREAIPVWEPAYSQPKGVRTLTSRADISVSLRWATLGLPAATFIEGDNLLPIRIRGSQEERNDIGNIGNIPVWGFASHPVPLAQVISVGKVTWQPSCIQRRNGVPTVTVGCDPVHGKQWNTLFADVRDEIEAMKIPTGYTMEWGGQKEKSFESQTTLLAQLPISLIIMAVIVVALFNSWQQPFIILLTLPLMLIGITVGLLVTELPFGFMALVGTMSLIGMLVRNGVVLMDQIDIEMQSGRSQYEAIVNASVERMRPVTVAALTVVVGMIPLLVRDPLFNSMAAAIMFGLMFATVMTLFVVPILYAILFKVKVE
ncbi:MAG: efflux RND transporter permease subunit [Planctomycetaceae bacterium]|jgi:multidrug efflux pump subunit AcrB|nr:efflux RND transporter permease subunit [Planctomycetaceae bacterium]